MSDITPGGGAPAPANTAPALSLVGQYIRDLSFENPGAPGSIMSGSGAPAFNVQINVGVKKQPDELYAVELKLNAKAERTGNVLFNVELVYGGVFRIRNVPEANLPPLLMVECPRLLFPFARQVLANVTQQGGFPPLMMEPVDFNGLFRQQLAAMAAQAPKAANGAPDPLVN
jgi:preprotein translocase subunit SecB